MKSSSKLLGGLLLALATVPAAQAFKLNLNLNKIGGVAKDAATLGSEVSPEDERQIGRELAAVLVGVAPPVWDREVQDYVNTLGRWIAQHSERPDLDWHFAVLDSDDVNAFAAPGGYVFLTKGMFLRLQNESELAAVLAHEIVHVLDRHHLAAVKKEAGVGLIAGLASLAGENNDHSETIDKVASAGRELYARGLNKEDEYSADLKGAVLASRSGYDAYGTLAVLQNLQAMDADDSSLELMFATHPSPSARIERVLPVLEMSLADYQDLKMVPGRFQKMRARLAR